MNARSRWILPLGAAVLLGAALMLRLLLLEPGAEPSSREQPRVTVAPPVAPVSASAGPVKPEPARAEPEKPQAHVETAEGPRATVVPIQPGDVVPAPVVEDAPPQQNDPIEPEKPQTAAWRHGKMVRITQLLGRDVDRLEQERKSAQARGDEA
jgi:hypothetical protein